MTGQLMRLQHVLRACTCPPEEDVQDELTWLVASSKLVLKG